MTNDATRVRRSDETPLQVKERPILFSGPMVRAILEGRKTQTRRVIKPQPQMAQMISERMASLSYPGMLWRMCPYGEPGERLWVRETFRTIDDPATCRQGQLDIDYAADGNERIMDRFKTADRVKWKPSIFMPRWASRLMLEIVGVRVERVQEISEADVKAEGTQIPVAKENRRVLLRLSGPYAPTDYLPRKSWKDVTEQEIFRAEYASLWDSLNAKRGFGWEKNPWVWVVEFKHE